MLKPDGSTTYVMHRLLYFVRSILGSKREDEENRSCMLPLQSHEHYPSRPLLVLQYRIEYMTLVKVEFLAVSFHIE